MRAIRFLKYYDKGSTVMGADQVSAGLAARGVDAATIYPRDLAGLSGAIVVAIKTSRWWDLARARRAGNRTVLDVQDTVVFKQKIKNLRLFDGLIFKNERQLADFGRPGAAGARDRVIYHQWDPRYRETPAGDGAFAIAYLGDRRSFALGDQIPGVVCCSGDYFRRALEFNCHLSIRGNEREVLYKPNCKISTAAACAVNLVTTRDVSAVELLGEEYPYYTTADLPSILETIERARREFHGPTWERGLAAMRRVRERTGMERILDDYLAYFELLD
ncbi:MAG TPA: hypothetical protein VIH93_15630 [Thermoanaerobaculia bacterium]